MFSVHFIDADGHIVLNLFTLTLNVLLARTLLVCVPRQIHIMALTLTHKCVQPSPVCSLLFTQSQQKAFWIVD